MGTGRGRFRGAGVVGIVVGAVAVAGGTLPLAYARSAQPVVGTGHGKVETALPGRITSFARHWRSLGAARAHALDGVPVDGSAAVTTPVAPAVASAPPMTAVPSTEPQAASPSPVAPAAASGPGYVAPANPPGNVAPDPAYTFVSGQSYAPSASLPCWQTGQSAWAPDAGSSQCLQAEVAATDHARAMEGLPPLRLPSDYGSLTPQEQLFVVTDIERVSRTEQPVAGLAAVVDAFAAQGAVAGEDPRFTFAAIPTSDWWGSNVVRGALNALDANYTWMYDDGYGGDNVDCTSPTSNGCWAHRDNELRPTEGGTLVMGAGDVAQPSGLACLTELLVAVADAADVPPLTYTWADAVAAGAGG